jgi:energy-converting hydrogenase Eha subunit F
LAPTSHGNLYARSFSVRRSLRRARIVVLIFAFLLMFVFVVFLAAPALHTDAKDIEQFRRAISQYYYFEMFYGKIHHDRISALCWLARADDDDTIFFCFFVVTPDDLPVWGFVGSVLRDDDEELDEDEDVND